MMAMASKIEECPSCRTTNFDPVGGDDAECKECGCIWNMKTGDIVREPPDDW